MRLLLVGRLFRRNQRQRRKSAAISSSAIAKVCGSTARRRRVVLVKRTLFFTDALLAYLFSSCPQVPPTQEEVAARHAGQGRVPDDGERAADQCAHRIERGDCAPEPARRRPRWCAVEPRYGTERYPASGRIEPAYVLSACEHQRQSSRGEQVPACCRASPVKCGPSVAPGTPSRRYGRTWLWILKGNSPPNRPLHLPTSIHVSWRPTHPWMHLPTS